MKLFIHQLKHWEYWPSWIIYTPSVLMWILFAIYFRQFKFYRWINPVMENGGLYGDKKSDMYKLLPKRYIPNTLLVSDRSILYHQDLFSKQQLAFPLIVKPDDGYRGKNVAIVNNKDELIEYASKHSFNFLIQELIDYPNELSIFYVRWPNQTNGYISALTLKSFVSVSGDGKNTIRQLLSMTPRFDLQIKKLENQLDLNVVLKCGENKIIVPFGNHNRGTQFIDGSSAINSNLEAIFNSILSGIDGFYSGRLDIKYQSLDDLNKGLNFKIIEINGAKSEPTHIYDTRYSFWKGQKILMKHQLQLFKIIKQSRSIERNTTTSVLV